MKEIKEEVKKNFVGIDLSKRTYEAVRIHSGSDRKEWFKGKTENASIHNLLNWLKDDDLVTLEAGNQSFRIVRMIKAKVKCKVIVLNPGDIALIYKSLKKTDKEDALKLAKLIQRIPIEELPVVPVPTKEEEHLRVVLSEHESYIQDVVRQKNRLHAIFTREGFTEISKKHLRINKNRLESISLLSGYAREEARRLNALLLEMENLRDFINSEINEILKEDSDYAEFVMSVPGIGPIMTAALKAYVGEFKRFSTHKQVAFYVGLVPKVQMSGDMVHYGHIIRRNNIIRAKIIQSAWALVRSEEGGEIKEFYKKNYGRLGKKKAIVAVARKILVVLFTMFKSGEMYRYMSREKLDKKLKSYGLIKKNGRKGLTPQ